MIRGNSDLEEPILTIIVHRKDEQYVANWKAKDIGQRNLIAGTAIDAAQRSLDWIRAEGTRKRRRGRPYGGYWTIRRLACGRA